MDKEQSTTMARLLATMDKSPGFAGLGDSIQTLSKLGDDLDGGTREMTAIILRDAALTSKLLRISNSSKNARGGRNISTIDQALMVLGINTVKSVALSLALLGSLSSKPQANQLHAEIVSAYFCGSLASEITRMNAPRYSAQEAQVAGLMQNLGRMMVTYYMYENIELARAYQAEKNVNENDAILHVFGMSFEEIGAAIARHWCLPDVLQKSMAPDIGKAPPRVATSSQVWQQLCASFARRVTDIVFRLPENREKIEIAKEIDFFRAALHLKESEVLETIENCLLDTDNVLAQMSFPSNVAQARTLLRKASERVHDLLSHQDPLTRDSVDGKSPLEVIQHLLRLIHDRHSFDHTLFCLPDHSGNLIAIAGVGKNASQVTAKFRCFGPKPDIFRAIMARKNDIFVANVRSPSYAKLVPDWYQEVVGSTSFLMLPLLIDDKLVGMIYGDYSQAHDSAPEGLDDGDMVSWRQALVKALQSEAVKS